MNCRQAETLIFAERDHALEATRRAALAAHLAECGACREKQAELADGAAAWRARDAVVACPPVEREWHAIRRRIRAQNTRATSLAGWRRPVWVSVASALAAIALMILVGPRLSHDSEMPARDWTYVSYVEVGESAGPTMVYEDPQSGWLVVWVADTGPETGET